LRIIPLAKPQVGRKEIRAVVKVLKGLNLAQGPEVKAFESEFSRIVGDRDCVAVNSGTSALHLSLLALGITKGDEVIVPSFTFAATANVVALVGATPVFVDIDPRTFNVNPELILEEVNSKTKAIIVVHLFGLPANMKRISQIAKENSLLIIEDAAQAHMAKIGEDFVGTFGDAAAFSFYPTKNMTSAEGGMVVLSNSNDARTCRLLRNQGMEVRYQNEIVGYNLRMTDIHASIGRIQLKKLNRMTDKRIANAEYLTNRLESNSTPFVPEGYVHVYHQYTLRVEKEREEFSKYLLSNGIDNGVYYPTPVHKLPSFNGSYQLAETEKASKEVLSLPVHPGLRKRDLDRIIRIFNNGIAKVRHK
jgi:dTDP-4-amino-4,6-dideoxygalactose transaminase